jgi:ATP-dependent DNA helicase RecG
MVALRSDSSIQYVKGIGPKRAEWFATIGVRTVGELLEYFPFRHESDRGEVAIEDLVPGLTATVRGEVVQVGGRPPALRCEVDDGTGTCVLRWFDRAFAGRSLFRGATVAATGRVQIYDGRPELIHPRVQVFEPGAVLLSQPAGPRRVGVYRGNDTIKSALIRRAVLTVLAQAHLPVDEVLPPPLLARRKLTSREQAIRHMHCPTRDADLAQARTRLAYEEFLLMELAMALRRRKRLALQAGQKLFATPEIEARIRARFPFALTPSQDAVVAEIVRDLQSGRPMTRLLQGDVGSGKTVVALYACLIAVASGKQAAIMAPTEILAHQHFTNIDRYLRSSRVRYVLLRGKLGKKERSETLAAIERGEVDLVVGTQALIQKDVAFNHLAVVIVDEQHKFGVLQRHEFRTKGPLPHYLVMTATPIPRTLAMTVFGDLDVSLIKQPPPGRGRIITKVVTAAQWETVMGYVRQRLERGEQAYVVCPMIGETTKYGEDHLRRPSPNGSEGPNAASLVAVTEAYQRLRNGPWRGLNVGLLHGSLRPTEKQSTIDAFATGRLHAVVATTVVEVGVDVANATIMIVEHAERYGLSQLHQLRGRVGRGSRDSLCVLIARDRTAKAGERLEVMAHTADGFKIAEADLRQRGPGQLFGTRQHGLPELHVANIVEDFSLLEQARQDAFDIVNRDPTLSRPEHEPLLPALKKMFGQKLALIDAA